MNDREFPVGAKAQSEVFMWPARDQNIIHKVRYDSLRTGHSPGGLLVQYANVIVLRSIPSVLLRAQY